MMQNQSNKIEEKSKENNSNSDYYEEDEIEENDNISYKNKGFYQISSNKNKQGNFKFKKFQHE